MLIWSQSSRHHARRILHATGLQLGEGHMVRPQIVSSNRQSAMWCRTEGEFRKSGIPPWARKDLQPTMQELARTAPIEDGANQDADGIWSEGKFGRLAAGDAWKNLGDRRPDWEYIQTNMQELINVRKYSMRAWAFLGLLISSAGLLLWRNWSRAKTQVSQESAEIVTGIIADKQLQFTAAEFSKVLLHELLTDKQIEKAVKTWLYQLLTDMQDDLGALVVKILHQEQVVEAVNRLADRLVSYLCANTTIHSQVGGLLVDAICLESSRNSAALWSCDLIAREDVQTSFQNLVLTALQSDVVTGGASELAAQIVADVLKSEVNAQLVKELFNDTLADEELQATAKEMLWNILKPWGWGRASDKGPQRSLRLIDELSGNQKLTQEELRVLKQLQARIKTEQRTPTTSTKDHEGHVVNSKAANGADSSAVRKLASDSPDTLGTNYMQPMKDAMPQPASIPVTAAQDAVRPASNMEQEPNPLAEPEVKDSMQAPSSTTGQMPPTVEQVDPDKNLSNLPEGSSLTQSELGPDKPGK
eukprot:gnl/MRDRNA2_/MRDRNA2_123651_c0_seq1.p1 gnl/MRDRNA2_/MRDRNA2_123651_c0~~gnl/MRDRNA2_/MRDRNA2_123651_c0_seq1.p1  ORF type:complete len:531 (+),score=114.27 gnl/MRDRNA2_/MRDRNA2_123651_c0_seq1:83-1675(+)